MVRQVWASAAGTTGSISADGRYFVFADWDTDGLMMRDLDSGETKVLEKGSYKEPQAWYATPVFSKDGKQLVYLWSNNHGKAEVRIGSLAESGKSRSLYSDKDWAIPTDWSPDGNLIAVLLMTESGTKIATLAVKDGKLEVVADGRKPVKDFGNRTMAARFSADGRYLAYTRPPNSKNSKEDIFVIDLERRIEVPLVPHPAEDLVMDWSPRSNHLLFASDRTGTMDLWAVEIGTDGKAREPVLVKADLGTITSIGITANGVFYYGVSRSTRDLYVASVDLHSGKLLSSPKLVTGRDFGRNSHAEWSPDGKFLAYHRFRDPSVICIRNWEAQEEREYPLKAPFQNVSGPSNIHWAPDQKTVRVRGHGTDPVFGIYSLDRASGEFNSVIKDEKGFFKFLCWPPVPVTKEGQMISFIQGGRGKRWLGRKNLASGEETLTEIPMPKGWRLASERIVGPGPNGASVVVVWEDDRGEFVVTYCDLENRKDSILARSKHPIALSPRSPDGNRVVVVIKGEDNRQLLRGFSLEQLPPPQIFETAFPDQAQLQRWTPAGHYLLFTKPVESKNATGDELWTISRARGEIKRTELMMKAIEAVSVHPDGMQIVLQAGETHSQIWAVENFLQRLASTN